MKLMTKATRMAVALVAASSAQFALAQETESEKASAFFDRTFKEALADKPMYLTYLGMKQKYGEWGDFSSAQDDRDLAMTKKHLEELKKIDFSKLSEQEKLSYRLFEAEAKDDIYSDRYRDYDYPVNQMHGIQSQLPSFLINMHRIDNVSDAEAYVSRLQKVKPLFDQLIVRLKTSEKLGVVPPKFVFPMVIRDSKNILAGKPFDAKAEKDNPIWADFQGKVNKLEASDEEKAKLLKDGKAALLGEFKAGYSELIDFLGAQEKRADTRDGVWKFPKGGEYYKYRLKEMTTTDMTADEIHNLGLAEVARIHDEMRAIKDKVGFKGDLQAFFKFMRTDEQFKLPNTDEGRQKYLDDAVKTIDVMKSRLDELFLTKPKADLVVTRVEPFREDSAGRAFYQRPALDGSRPGRYYVNLADMDQMAVYELEALAYHEGIPGHHMQLAIAQELEGIPTFRKIGGYTAYTEGWGLYSETLPKEIGFYQDPYSDFGRLSMELWRACRLVVDTGIHDKKWTREQAIQYLRDNTPSPELDIVKAIERYIVMPGQATAYKIGQIKIQQLRAKAKKALGKKFDIRKFHDVILRNGMLPLDILEEQVDQYIAKNKA
ncbi:DUF885 domain-containing protein [Pseudoteredinibacter isoporae]|uniref:Uncharacterized protein (DUF885 family) n=1 Tax=Pseudoteredinibacter isoporae TaxID=570281 RepID=A0A7X0JRS0_9GAMM|nr:DUF885 domain-containing protein [Pseudoteredinibacter isoporae]MBB6520151.1 uncharacterized protein (DUF885 family) [Pseudoteredinibacter isoporae]